MDRVLERAPKFHFFFFFFPKKNKKNNLESISVFTEQMSIRSTLPVPSISKSPFDMPTHHIFLLLTPLNAFSSPTNPVFTIFFISLDLWS